MILICVVLSLQLLPCPLKSLAYDYDAHAHASCSTLQMFVVKYHGNVHFQMSHFQLMFRMLYDDSGLTSKYQALLTPFLLDYGVLLCGSRLESF